MLTKEFLLKKNPKYKSLEELQTINLWGLEINDISILSQCKNLEILSLSLNNISNISPLQKCKNLRELYLRKNKISSLSQIDYLKNLKNLRILWLDENPISNLNNYKNYVLNILPQIIKLDNIPLIKREYKRHKTAQKIERISNINEKKFILRRVNSNEPIQINLLLSTKKNNNNISNGSNSSLLKFNNIISNGSFSDFGDLLKQRSNSTNKKKSVFKKLNIKIKKKENKRMNDNKIKIINNYKLNVERKLSPRDNMQIRIPISNSNSNIKNLIRNKTNGHSLAISSDISTIINENDENLTISNNLRKIIPNGNKNKRHNNKKLINDTLNLINKMDIHDLYFIKKKIEEKIILGKKKIN